MSKFNADNARLSVPQKMIAWLFCEQELSLGFNEWLKLLSATIIIRNRQFSQDFFDALSDKIATSSADPELSDLKKDIILFNALSFIAFADPQEGQTITIRGIKYEIEKIALTSGWLSSTYYAYGLKAVSDTNAQSFLIFQGTTTPSDHGFLAGVMADTRPFGAIGTQLYARGQKNIQSWINKEQQRTKKRVLCTGQSLGGAMSLHAHVHQPDAVDFFIVNPPGLTSREKRIYEDNRKSVQLPSATPRTLTVVSHVNDPVFALGSQYLPEGTKVYKHGQIIENSIVAHAKAPDCRKNMPDLEFTVHDHNHIHRSASWKLIKAILFFGVLILHAIALPFRLLFKIGQELTQVIGNRLKKSDQHVAEANLIPYCKNLVVN